MADNLTVTPGAGANVSTEEVTTLNGAVVPAQHMQRVGPAFRTGDATAVDAATGAGAVTPGTQRMTLANDDPLVQAAQSSAPALVKGSLLGVRVPLVTSTTPYQALDTVGGKIVFLNALRAVNTSGYAVTAQIESLTAIVAAMDLYLFHSDPADAGSSLVDNGPLNLAAIDRAKRCGHFAFAVADFKQISAAPVAYSAYSERRVPIAGGATTSVWGALVIRGAQTLGSTADIFAQMFVDAN